WTCCPEGWRLFQKSCYFISTDKMSGNESEQNCTGMGSHLVVITTEEEQISQIFRIREANVYIGLSAQEVSEWHWVDQTPYNGTAAFWRPGEPSNVRNEMCVVI
ncbi:CLC4D protein, partial [Alectura lathami]|nr:CLC4D protein [Alectura lathami]